MAVYTWLGAPDLPLPRLSSHYLEVTEVVIQKALPDLRLYRLYWGAVFFAFGRAFQVELRPSAFRDWFNLNCGG